MNENKIVPYDTGKVKIGIAYQRPVRRDMTAEELRIQRFLLDGTPFSRSDRVVRVVLVTLLLALAYSLAAGR